MYSIMSFVPWTLLLSEKENYNPGHSFYWAYIEILWKNLIMDTIRM